MTLAAFGLSSCSSIPKKDFQSVDKAEWQASALVKDYESKKSYVVALDGITDRPNRMRVSATTSLGIHLMTMTMKDGLVEYIIPHEKEFYSGPVSDHILRPAMSIDLHPKYLNTLVFDEVPEGENWTCQQEDGLLSECINPVQDIQVIWGKRQGDYKTVSVKGNQFDIQMSLTKFRPIVEVPANSFDLTAPDNFKKYQIR